MNKKQLMKLVDIFVFTMVATLTFVFILIFKGLAKQVLQVGDEIQLFVGLLSSFSVPATLLLTYFLARNDILRADREERREREESVRRQFVLNEELVYRKFQARWGGLTAQGLAEYSIAIEKTGFTRDEILSALHRFLCRDEKGSGQRTYNSVMEYIDNLQPGVWPDHEERALDRKE